MWDRKISAILFLVFLCTAFSHGENNSAGSHDVELTLESNHSSKGVLYQAKNCVIDADCHHLGKCETTRDGSQQTCSCKKGTSGDLCETVDECAGELKVCDKLGDASCVFDVVLEKAVCKCDNDSKTFVPDEERCMKMCNDTKPCQNGGQCVQNVCSCLNGTRGDFCEIVEYCWLHNDCRFGECVYNVTAQEGSCKCKGSNDIFDDYSNFCRECDCGSGMQSCSFKERRKICNCNIPYAEQFGECKLCQCKSHSNPSDCHFDGFEKICKCDKGYVQHEDDCKECDCGRNGTCSFTYFGSKSCNCDKGYTEHNGICKECDCGENGDCRFNFEGKKICSCKGNFQEYKGMCKECDCGANSICKLFSYAIQCSCRSGYGILYGKCVACNCYPGTECVFDHGMFSKKCICPEGYANDGESCKECDCKVKGAKCSLGQFFNNCTCPEGYESVHDPWNILKNYCDDIDECKQLDVCPSSTKCVNTIGSYDCVCKKGYEDNAFDDIKKDGCRDIDECVRNYKPCNSENAVCSNTIGSYECRCKMGYTLLKSYEEKMNICLSDSRPWRTATIVLGCLSGIMITVFILIIIFRKFSFR